MPSPYVALTACIGLARCYLKKKDIDKVIESLTRAINGAKATLDLKDERNKKILAELYQLRGEAFMVKGGGKGTRKLESKLERLLL